MVNIHHSHEEREKAESERMANSLFNIKTKEEE
jgi:hypothetical protein